MLLLLDTDEYHIYNYIAFKKITAKSDQSIDTY